MIYNYLRSISLPGEKWYLNPYRGYYYISDRDRVASARSMPFKLLSVRYHNQMGDMYFTIKGSTVLLGEAKAEIGDEVYKPTPASLKAIYDEEDEKDKSEMLKLAEEMLGSASHPEFKLMYNALLGARQWGRKIERNPPTNVIW